MEQKEILKKAIADEDVDWLVTYFFGYELTIRQRDIVWRIAFKKNRRLSISAMTRYGKTFCVAISISLLIILNTDLKIALIAPKSEQARILRDYMVDLMMRSPDFLRLAEIDLQGIERMKKEASRQRQTFKNGCEYRVYSAEGDADRLMGFGADVVVKDEACLIGRTANAKIMRMLGDNPDEGVLIELLNPWDRDNVAYEHTLDDHFYKIHVGYRDALEEGRTTESFINEQRKELTPIEFVVLYESLFPEESEDSLFNLGHVRASFDKGKKLSRRFDELKEKLKDIRSLPESEYKRLRDEKEDFKKVISCDVADKGLDETVVIWGNKRDNEFEVVDYYSEKKSDNMAVAGKLMNLIRNYVKDDEAVVNIDCIGIGTGVVSRLNELLSDAGLKNVHLVKAHFGESPLKKETYKNKKAENYFRLRALFEEGFISLPPIPKLLSQLSAMKWEYSAGTALVKIVDPSGYSPDWADALVYFVWLGREFTFSFLETRK